MSATVTAKNITADVASWVERNLAPSGLVTDLRKEGLDFFQKLGLPGNKSEEYKHTPITRTLEKNFNFLSDNPPAKETAPKEFFIPGLEADVLVFVNGVFAPQHSSIAPAAAGVSIMTLKEAVDTKKEIINAHFAKHVDFRTDALAALNTASWMDGTFIHIPGNTIVERPIVIHHIHDTQAGQVISAARNLVVVDTGAKITLVEKTDSIGSANGFSNLVSELVVAENAELNLYVIQNDKGNRYHYNLTQITQADSSRVNTYTFTLDGKFIRNNLQLALDGQGIESHMFGLYALTGDTLADNHTVVDHKKAHSFSNELYKGIMDGNSRGVFNGKIYVRPNAQKTNAFQANRNILLTDKAAVNTKPQLEIWADDVKCSHGCTTGQLDEEAIFYLQSRGISKEAARAMMLYAFAGEILENVKHPVLKAYIDQMISERLHKDF